MNSPLSTFLCSVVIVLGFCIAETLAQSETPALLPKNSFEDARCKCVCPKFKKDANSSVPIRTVFISSSADPNQCTCEYVVKNNTNINCALCQCKYENRNTTTIKVVVIIIICVIALLLVYMLFLLCLDPLIARRPAGQYQEQTNEEEERTSTSQIQQFDGGARPRLGRQTSVINYVSSEQARWKTTVREQRKNIYDKHSMLN